MADPTPAQGTVFRNLVTRPHPKPRSIYTRALFVTVAAPVAPVPVQTTIRVTTQRKPISLRYATYLFDPTVIGPFVPPVVVPPQDPPPPPVIIPDPPPPPPVDPEDPDPPPDPTPDPSGGDIPITVPVKGSLTLTPDPAGSTFIDPDPVS